MSNIAPEDAKQITREEEAAKAEAERRKELFKELDSLMAMYDADKELHAILHEIVVQDSREVSMRGLKVLFFMNLHRQDRIINSLDAIGSVLVSIEESLKQPFYGTGAKEPKK